MQAINTEAGRVPAQAGARPLLLMQHNGHGGEQVLPRQYLHREFPIMQDLVEEGQCGVWRVSHFMMTPEDARDNSLRALMAGDLLGVVSPGRYTRLSMGNTIVMSDTDMEKNSNRWPVYKATGDVLIAGLGLGMILWPILYNPQVTSVTVVEQDQAVIKLVAPSLQRHPHVNKLVITQASIDEWTPLPHQKFDMIYFDIWATICEDNLPHIARLHQRGKFWKRSKDSHMLSWQAEYLRSERDSDRRRSNHGFW